ncbi:MAG: sensor histidine kinase [Verrucomicrobiales bacterium]
MLSEGRKPDMARRWKFPLFGHVLGWFFLNLAILALIFSLVLFFHWRAGLDSLLISGATPRLTSIASVVAGELRASDPKNWPDVIERMGESFGTKFHLCRPDGQPLQGQTRAWPDELARRLEASFPPPPRGQRPPGDRPPPPDAPPGDFRPGPPDDRPRPNPPRPPNSRPVLLPDGSPAPPNPSPRPADPGASATSPPQPSLLIWHREANGPFWVAFRVRISMPGRPSGPSEVLLLARTENLAASGWMPDPRPWIWILLGAIVISGLVWWPFVRSITRRLRAMDAATARLAEGEFDVRLNPGNVGELADLALSIEAMSARLKELVHGQRRFLGDVAHELCSPIARMEMGIGILEGKLARQSQGEKESETLDDVREDLREMAGLVNELLSFTRAASGGMGIVATSLEIAPLVRAVAEREGVSDLSITCPADATIMADRDLLRRALANIFRNCLRHAGPGTVYVEVEREKNDWCIRVTDEGPGAPEEELARLFEPFYRPDASRSRETGGSGLGLAIVRSCIQACGGSVSLRNAKPRGLEVAIRLPGEKA